MDRVRIVLRHLKASPDNAFLGLTALENHGTFPASGGRFPVPPACPAPEK